MGRLRAALQSRYKQRDEDVKIHTPRNLETLNLTFRGERVAKVSAIAGIPTLRGMLDPLTARYRRQLEPLQPGRPKLVTCCLVCSWQRIIPILYWTLETFETSQGYRRAS